MEASVDRRVDNLLSRLKDPNCPVERHHDLVFGTIRACMTELEVQLRRQIGEEVGFYTGMGAEPTGLVKYPKEGLELDVAGALHSLGIVWLYECRSFPYRFSRKHRFFTPDFYLPDFKVFLECKQTNHSAKASEIAIQAQAVRDAGFGFELVYGNTPLSDLPEIIEMARMVFLGSRYAIRLGRDEYLSPEGTSESGVAIEAAQLFDDYEAAETVLSVVKGTLPRAQLEKRRLYLSR